MPPCRGALHVRNNPAAENAPVTREQTIGAGKRIQRARQLRRVAIRIIHPFCRGNPLREIGE
jgi:hypothetical protein